MSLQPSSLSGRYTADADSAQVRFPPPVMLLIAMVCGGLVHHFHPLPFVALESRWTMGILLGMVGIVLIFLSANLFHKVQTKLQPWKPTTALIHSGPYLYSRNPIYLGFILIGLGASVAANSLWMALSLIPLTMVYNKFVIEKEEVYLEKKFGEKYLGYKVKVRRWL